MRRPVLLTANTETVYALGHLDLKADGPTVLEAPPKMLGLAMDALQRYLVDIGIPGPDKVAAALYLMSVEDSGGEGRPVVLLIMGLGMQLIAWPPAFVQALEDAGYRVVRCDNRDIGLSEHFDHMGAPNLLWESFKHKVGMPVNVALYRAATWRPTRSACWMRWASAQAHVVGVSMGGMIAQRVAAGRAGSACSA